MSFWDTVKGWFNIGGVTVKITRVEDPFPSQDTVMKGNYTLTTKIPKTVLSTQVEFYAEEKYREREKEGEEEKEKTNRISLGSYNSTDVIAGDDYPFDLAAGESRQMSFILVDVNVDGIVGRMRKKGGFVGTLGQAAQFTASFSAPVELRYYLQVTADVKGAAFDPSDTVPIRVMPGKS